MESCDEGNLRGEEVKRILAEIRTENRDRYGTGIGGKDGYGHTLLRDRYPDRTHFIYELLQNTEDAYSRRGKVEEVTDFPVRFDLYGDRLEVRHHGIPFDAADVRAICGVVLTTKKNSSEQIGKFGISHHIVHIDTRRDR